MVVEGFNILFSSIGVMMAVSLIAVAYQFPLEEMPGLRQLLGLICGGVVRPPSHFFFPFAGFTAAPPLSPLPLRSLCRDFTTAAAAVARDWCRCRRRGRCATLGSRQTQRISPSSRPSARCGATGRFAG